MFSPPQLNFSTFSLCDTFSSTFSDFKNLVSFISPKKQALRQVFCVSNLFGYFRKHQQGTEGKESIYRLVSKPAMIMYKCSLISQGNFEKLYKVHISELSNWKTEEAGIFIHPFPLVMGFFEL